MLHEPAGTLMSVNNLRTGNDWMKRWHLESNLCFLLNCLQSFIYLLLGILLEFTWTCIISMSSIDARCLLCMSLQNQEILKHSNEQHVSMVFVLSECSLKQQALVPNVFSELVN